MHRLILIFAAIFLVHLAVAQVNGGLPPIKAPERPIPVKKTQAETSAPSASSR
jgi:hypothetical protein